MSTNYYWIMPDPEAPPRRKVMTPAGVVIEIEYRPTIALKHGDDPRIHIGKTTAKKFWWAQDQAVVEGVCRWRETFHVVEDEGGKQYTGREFLEVISVYAQDMSMVGQAFS